MILVRASPVVGIGVLFTCEGLGNIIPPLLPGIDDGTLCTGDFLHELHAFVTLL